MSEILSPPRCPRCKGQMVLRKAYKGSDAEKDFWGCSSYPRCRGTQNLSQEHQRELATAILKRQQDIAFSATNPSKDRDVPPPIPEVRTELTDKQKEQLRKLRDRLLNLSSRNRSVKLSRLDAKWTFDLSWLNSINQKRANEIIGFCLKNSGEISIFPKPKNEKESEVLKSLFSKITHLDRSVKEIEREKGLHDLYLGFPFISGIPQGSGTVIQAPIFLIPVKLERKTPIRGQVNWVLSVTKDNPPIFNKTLFLTLSKMCNLKVNQNLFDEEIPDELYGEQTLIQKVHEMLNEYGIVCHIDDEANDTVFDPLETFKSEDIDKHFSDGKILIKQNAVLGHFPQSNSSIQKDYDEFLKMSQEELGEVLTFLEESSNDSDEVEANTSFYREVNYGDQESDSIETIDKRQERDNFFLLPSDSSQDRILLNLENPSTKGLVIWGPPGTGKSQTIVNIVGDCLSKNKSVLIVSQKRAALDVVFDRLGNKQMDNLLGLVHDAKEDRKDLYKKLNQELSNLKLGDLQRKKLIDPSPEIESVTKTLKEVADAYNDDSFGISLGELYRISNNEESNLILEPTWVHKSFETIEQITQQLNSLQGHGMVLSKTKFDSHRKPLSQSSPDLQAIEKTIRSLSDETYMEASFIHRRNTFKPSTLTSRLQDYYEAIDKFSQYKNLFKFFSLNWWKLKAKLNKHYLFAKEHLDKISSQSYDQLSKILVDDQARFISAEVKEAKFEDSELASFFYFVKNEFFRLRGFDHDYSQLSDEVKKVVSQLNLIFEDTSLNSRYRWGDYFQHSIFKMWVNELEKKHSVVAQVRSGRVEELRKRLRELLDLKVEYSVQELKSRYRVGLGNTKSSDEIIRDVSKQRSVPSIRKLNEKYMDRVDYRKLLPVWLSSPESVSDMFPLKKGLFDVVIFDEASQCTVENGLPAIFRGKQVVIAGDEKQLPPSKFFEASIDSDDDHTDEDSFATIEPSLLTLSKKNLHFQSHMLEWHYRSKKQELISFSNQQFYDGRMKVAPNVIPFKKGNKPAIEWIGVEGFWENRSNEIEAEAVVKRIKHYLSLDNPPTLGVITFNLQQKTIIQDKIDHLEANDPEFSALLEKDKKRRSEAGKELDIRLFVKNIENVQGDERDIIIFSIGYAPTGPGGRVYQRFGPLGTAGGENRLNVAITRAIRKIDIVSSIDPENDLNTSMSKNAGPKIFQKYLAFAKAVAHENYEKADKILQEINPHLRSQGNAKVIHFDSPFEEQVFKELTRLGYEVHTQVGQSGFRIDMAVVHPNNPDKYILGIECDGAMYHSGISIRERDVFRQRFLESRGWVIHRIWSSNWWSNKQKEIEKVSQLIRELLKMEKTK